MLTLLLIAILCFLGVTVLFFMNNARHTRTTHDLRQQLRMAQERAEDSRAGWAKETKQLDSLMERFERVNRRTNGYSDILVLLFNELRKASDRYERVQRSTEA